MMRAIILSCAILTVVHAQITFTADATSPITTPLSFPILDCVGTGHAALALRADYRAHLAAVQRDIGFKHIRGHGSFDFDMSAYLDGKTNLINLFSVTDFYLSVGIKPIYELSFMPEELAEDPSKTIMHYKGGTSPPKSQAAWGQFITEVVQGFVDRYGVSEVRQWSFETWCVTSVLHSARVHDRTHVWHSDASAESGYEAAAAAPLLVWAASRAMRRARCPACPRSPLS